MSLSPVLSQVGNLGGEQYQDLARGPLNEGGMYAEREGYYYPSPPGSKWDLSNPGFIVRRHRIIWCVLLAGYLQWMNVPMSVVFNN